MGPETNGCLVFLSPQWRCHSVEAAFASPFACGQLFSTMTWESFAHFHCLKCLEYLRRHTNTKVCRQSYSTCWSSCICLAFLGAARSDFTLPTEQTPSEQPCCFVWMVPPDWTGCCSRTENHDLLINQPHHLLFVILPLCTRCSKPALLRSSKRKYIETIWFGLSTRSQTSIVHQRGKYACFMHTLHGILWGYRRTLSTVPAKRLLGMLSSSCLTWVVWVWGPEEESGGGHHREVQRVLLWRSHQPRLYNS